MKKVLFLMFLLLLMGLGAAGVKAQVRIGGDTVPNAAAVLDLNVNNDTTPTGNKGGLALPRISLASTTAQLNGATPITGMLVYNTNASITGGSGVGMYFWDGNTWVKVSPYVPAPPKTATLTVKHDTTINVTLTAPTPSFVQVAFPGLAQTEFCRSPGSWILGSMTNTLQISGLAAGTYGVHIVCYAITY